MARTSRSERRPSGRPGSPRARLFVALDLPAETRDALAVWRDELLVRRNDLRPVAPQSLHVTLAFLGYRPEKEIETIGEAARQALAGSPACRLAPAAIEPIPPRRPRLFALDLEDPEGSAVAVQGKLSDALAAGGFYKPEKRPFWPHVTIARVKRNLRADPVEAGAAPFGAFEAAEVVLYRSTLRPQGALYEPLAQMSLGRDS